MGLRDEDLRLWAPARVRRLGRELADLAARELTRTGGAVRPPDFWARTQRLLRGGRALGVAARARALADASLHLNHPRYMAQQVAAPIPAAALVESLVAALNQSIAVRRMSPAATPVDRALMARFARVFGFGPAAEGTLVPGGSYANLTALLMARAALAPRSWRQGGARIAVLAGAQTHYSIRRAAAIVGLGAEAVFSIPLDASFRTDPARASEALAAARRAGYRRFILVGSCGSTSTGGCDDLRALGAFARGIGAWFHVDAAHGGGFVFSRGLRGRLAGVERADSLAFDPHKMMFMPLTAGAVLAREGRRLRAAFAQEAPYLFRSRRAPGPTPAAAGGGEDVGEFTIACSQRFDALKIWLVWETYGAELWGRLVDSVCAVAAAGFRHCEASSVLAPAHRPESNILCFRARAPLAPRSGAAADRFHAALEDAVNASGQGYLSSTVLDGRRVLRLVVMNPRSTAEDVRAVLRLTERGAKKLAASPEFAAASPASATGPRARLQPGPKPARSPRRAAAAPRPAADASRPAASARPRSR